MLTEVQFELLKELAQRDSAQYLENSVKGYTLAPFQCMSLAIAVIEERSIISLDTGLGKTMIAGALINILDAMELAHKWLFVCKNDNLIQTYKKLNSYMYNCTCSYCTGESAKIFRSFVNNEISNTDIIIISYEALINNYVNRYLYENRSMFDGIFLDESHEFGNGDSYTAQIIEGMLSCGFRYGYMLTATPLQVSPNQFVNQLRMLDKDILTGINIDNEYGIWDNGRVIGYHDLESIENLIWYRYINFTRSELGLEGEYTPVLIICDPKESYKRLSRTEVFKVICGDKTGPALPALGDLCVKHKRECKKGLVYINRNILKDIALEYLQSLGLRVAIRDGHVTNTTAKKDAVKRDFNEGLYDVVITNAVTGADMQCDYICFYEETYAYAQMKGRGERGLLGNNLEIDFIIVKDTAEVRYFYENVFKRGLLLEQACGKQVKGISEIKNQLLKSMNVSTDFDLMQELEEMELDRLDRKQHKNKELSRRNNAVALDSHYFTK